MARTDLKNSYHKPSSQLISQLLPLSTHFDLCQSEISGQFFVCVHASVHVVCAHVCKCVYAFMHMYMHVRGVCMHKQISISSLLSTVILKESRKCCT